MFDQSGIVGSCVRIAILLMGISLSATASSDDASDFRWGAVGHSNWVSFGPSYAYNRVPIKKQMELLRAAGLSWYRTSCVESNCGELIAQAKSNGVSILKASGGKPDATVSEQVNYTRAYAMGASDAQIGNSAIGYFEAGNEVENWVGLTGDGSARGQYNAQRYQQARGFVRGLIDGIHSANSSAKVLVDDSGWCHYGFLQALWEDGVRWDITAFHWYSNQGNVEHAGCGGGANVAAIHANFGLPVWITEFNSKAAAASNDPVAEAAWVSDFMTQVHSTAAKYDIEAAFVYELLDEPNLTGTEAHFGIYDGNGAEKMPAKTVLSVINSFAGSAPKPPTSLEAK